MEKPGVRLSVKGEVKRQTHTAHGTLVHPASECWGGTTVLGQPRARETQEVEVAQA